MTRPSVKFTPSSRRQPTEFRRIRSKRNHQTIRLAQIPIVGHAQSAKPVRREISNETAKKASRLPSHYRAAQSYVTTNTPNPLSLPDIEHIARRHREKIENTDERKKMVHEMLARCPRYTSTAHVENRNSTVSVTVVDDSVRFARSSPAIASPLSNYARCSIVFTIRCTT